MDNEIYTIIRRYESRGLYNPSLNYAKGIKDYEQAVKSKDNEKIKTILIAYGGLIGLYGGAYLQKFAEKSKP